MAEKTNPPIESKSKILSSQLFMASMSFTGLAIIYGFKVNFIFGLVATENNATALKLSYESEPYTYANITNTMNMINYSSNKLVDNLLSMKLIEWNKFQEISLIAYFLSCMLYMLLGEKLAKVWSAKWMMNGAVLLNSVACILPFFVSHTCNDTFIFLVLISLQGIGTGISFPAINFMIVKWSSPKERSIMAYIIYTGAAFGFFITLNITTMAPSLGWPNFYIIEGLSLLSLIWCIIWGLMITDSPKEQKFISSQKKNYILKRKHGEQNIPKKLPLGQISKPLAILVVHLFLYTYYGWYLLLFKLPTLLNQILKFSPTDIGLIYVSYMFASHFYFFIIGILLLNMKRSQTMTMSTYMTIGNFFAVIGLLLIIKLNINFKYIWKALLISAFIPIHSCIHCMYCNFLINHVGTVPNFTNALLAWTNFVAILSGIIAWLMYELFYENLILKVWRIVWFLAIIVHTIGIIIYIFFWSCKKQPWNRTRNVVTHGNA